jgi:Leucine-rich repeat (LRR) protein
LLNELRSLTDLDLSRTNTDDTIAPALATLVQLESLDLSFTHVTDESLVHLMGLRKLWKLDLGGTLVSKGGVETIQRALPDTSVQWAWAQ